MKKLLVAALAAGLSLTVVSGANAQTKRTEVGVLTCHVAAGGGFIIGSKKNLTCAFDPSDGITAVRESYAGEITKYGIDIGVTEGTIIKWLVLAPTTEYPPRALAGTYVGATGEATLGVGLGANALVGGSDKTIALQPISVQAQTGLNLAIGAAKLTLY